MERENKEKGVDKGTHIFRGRIVWVSEQKLGKERVESLLALCSLANSDRVFEKNSLWGMIIDIAELMKRTEITYVKH